MPPKKGKTPQWAKTTQRVKTSNRVKTRALSPAKLRAVKVNISMHKNTEAKAASYANVCFFQDVTGNFARINHLDQNNLASVLSHGMLPPDRILHLKKSMKSAQKLQHLHPSNCDHSLKDRLHTSQPQARTIPPPIPNNQFSMGEASGHGPDLQAAPLPGNL
jgi:hypothetical protein